MLKILIVLDELQWLLICKTVTSVYDFDDSSFDSPWLAPGECDVVAFHAGDSALKKQMLWHRTHHLQDPQLESLGRCQYPLQAKHGRDEFHNFGEALKIRDVVGVSTVPSIWQRAAWHIAFSHNMISMNFAPNRGTLVGYLFPGDLTCVLIDFLAGFLELQKQSQSSSDLWDAGTVSLETVLANFETLNVSDWQALDSKVVAMVVKVVKIACSVLYVPCGWILLEVAKTDKQPILNFAFTQ